MGWRGGPRSDPPPPSRLVPREDLEPKGQEEANSLALSPCFSNLKFGVGVGRSWLLAPGRSWTPLDAPGRPWTLLDAPGRPWTLLDAPGRSWTLLDAPGSWLLAPGRSWLSPVLFFLRHFFFFFNFGPGIWGPRRCAAGGRRAPGRLGRKPRAQWPIHGLFMHSWADGGGGLSGRPGRRGRPQRRVPAAAPALRRRRPRRRGCPRARSQARVSPHLPPLRVSPGRRWPARA